MFNTIYLNGFHYGEVIRTEQRLVLEGDQYLLRNNIALDLSFQWTLETYKHWKQLVEIASKAYQVNKE
jgi:hypothetical protein